MPDRIGGARFAAFALFASLAAWPAAAAPPQDTPYPGVMTVAVDATDLDHRLFAIYETLDVSAGPLTLLFPRWLPGDHGPYGKPRRMAGLVIRAGDQRLAWQRDPLDPSAIRVDVPAGARRLDIAFQHVNPLDGDGDDLTMSRTLIRVQWESDLLYPAGWWSSRIPIEASLRLPPGWQAATALRNAAGVPAMPDAQGWAHYGTTSLEHLVDSPVVAGLHYRHVDLDPPGAARPVALHLFADSEESLTFKPAQVESHRRLVQQADKLFGTRHFRHYDFLLWQSDDFGTDGLEHHESSEDGVAAGYFENWDKQIGDRLLLPHEYTHSWNGKFRRPADLWTPNFNEPMQNSLLWVYEGQTEYWQHVLAARSGLVDEALARDAWAELAAWSEYHVSRRRRPLQDTTNEATMADESHHDWGNWQGGVDYYYEGALLWLEVDALIRQQTRGQRSLDDFARRFFDVEGDRVDPLTYRFEDVVAALDAVSHWDWTTFLRRRLDAVGGPSPATALESTGWRLAWHDTESDTQRLHKRGGETTGHFSFSLGVIVAEKDGVIKSVEWDSPAFAAGLTGGVRIVAVGMQEYKPERLAQAITTNKDGQHPIELLVKDGERYRMVRIDWRGGLRYPALERIAGTPDLLGAQMAPRR